MVFVLLIVYLSREGSIAAFSFQNKNSVELLFLIKATENVEFFLILRSFVSRDVFNGIVENALRIFFF